jgi:hypothetical protein
VARSQQRRDVGRGFPLQCGAEATIDETRGKEWDGGGTPNCSCSLDRRFLSDLVAGIRGRTYALVYRLE